ncbi:MAG: tetratricopeptide repeat protein, partial [Candidatus Eisenbacteria sp.]|nr:tetratricopeptide repeat protein [Candidatus Eisenbacteria bacterium]
MSCSSTTHRRFREEPSILQSPRWPLLVLFLLAFTVRLVHLVTMRNSPFFQYPIMDSLIHDEWAWTIASGGETPWHPPFFRAPLYPYFLALIYSVFGHSHTWARIVQMVLGSVSVVLVFAIGRRIFDQRVAWIAGLLACFYWMFVYYEGELLIVPLILFLNLAGLLLLIGALEKPGALRFFLVGLLFGMSAIARPNILLFPAALVVWLLLRHRRAGLASLAKSAAPLVSGLVLAILPVTAANTLSGDPVLIASQGGVNFYIGNNAESDAIRAVVPGTRSDWWGGYHDTVLMAEQARGRSLKPSEVSNYWYGRGIEFITSQPRKAARLFLRKFCLFWNHREFGNNQDIYFIQERSPVLRALSMAGFGIIAPFGLIGMGLAWRRLRPSRMLSVFVVVYMLSVILFFVNARYRMPVVPVLLVFAAYAGTMIFDKIKCRDLRGIAAPGVMILLLTVAVNTNFHGLEKSNAAFGHYSLGLTYRHAGEPDRAIEEFLKALDHEPDRRDARFNLAIAFIETGRSAQAEAMLRELVSRYPEDAESRYALGNAMAAMGDLDTAVRELSVAISLRPYYYEAWHSLGVAQYGSGRLEEAEASFRRALEIHP